MAITQTQTLPPQFVSDLGKDYATQMLALTKQPLDTTKFQPMLAGQDQAQKDAYAMATKKGEGIGAFEPYLKSADQFQQQAAGLTGPGAYQQFMSPYQQDVIDATLSEFDKQAAMRQQAITDQQAQLGVLGSGRAGVQTAEYQRKSDLDRALLAAQLNQAGFTQANQLAAQAFGQQGQLAGLQSGLAGQQLGLATTVPGLQQQALGLQQGLAGQDFQFRQAQADATREANRLRQFEAIVSLARLGQGISGLTPGAGTVTTQSGIPAAAPSPIGSALTAGIGAFGLGKLFGL